MNHLGFILDFENTVEEIRDAFKPFYEMTEVDEPTDPNILYNFDFTLREAPVLRQSDIDQFALVFFKNRSKQNKNDHGKYNQWVDPAVSRYKEAYRDHTKEGEVYNEEGELFKSNLRSFVRIYSFLSQVIDFVDPDLHKLYAYGGLLLTKLPYRSNAGSINLNEEVALESYRLEKTFEGSAVLDSSEDATVTGPSEVGTGGAKEEDRSPLSSIIKVINDKYGTDWTDDDRLLFDQIAGDMVNNESLAEKMRANSKEQVKPVFEAEAMNAFVNRHGRNEKIVGDFLQNEQLRKLIISALLDDVYQKANEEL